MELKEINELKEQWLSANQRDGSFAIKLSIIYSISVS